MSHFPPPTLSLKKPLNRVQGDLSDAKLAMLLPPESGDDEEIALFAPPPIKTSPIPPPVRETKKSDDQDAKAKQRKRLSGQQWTLLKILLGSFPGTALLIVLYVFVFPPGGRPQPVVPSVSSVCEKSAGEAVPPPAFKLEDNREIEFVKPNESAIPCFRSSLVAAIRWTPPLVCAFAILLQEWNTTETTTLAAHRAPISAVAVNPTGTVVATGSLDRTVVFWNTETGKELSPPKTVARSGITAVAFTKDGRHLLTGSADRAAVLWAIDDGREIRQFPTPKGSVTALASSPNNELLVVGVENGQGIVWDLKTGKAIKPLDTHSRTVSAVAFAPDSQRVVLASLDKTLSVWNPIKGEKIVEFKKHDGPVGCVAFDLSGNRIISGSADKKAMIWNSWDGREVQRLEGHTAEVVFVAFAPDGVTAYTASKDQTFVQWDTRTGKPLVRCRLDVAPIAAAMSADAFQTVFFKAVDSKATLCRTESLGFLPPGKPAVTFKNHPFTKLPTATPTNRFEETPQGSSVAFSLTSVLAVSAGPGENGIVWNTQTGKTLHSFSHTAPLTSVRFSADGRLFACGATDGMVLVFQSPTGKSVYKLRGHTAAVNAVAFSADAKRLLSAASDRTLVLWNLETGRSMGALLGHTDKVYDVAVAQDMSKTVSVSADKTVRIWNTSGKTLKKLDDHAAPLVSLVFAPNDEWFATGGEDKTVVVWDTKEFKPIKTLTGFPEPPKVLAVKPDSSVLATGGDDGVAVFWETQTWEPFHVFPQIPKEIEEKQKETPTRPKWTKEIAKPVDYEPIKSIAFGKDGKMLTSGGSRTLLWDVVNLVSAKPFSETESTRPRGDRPQPNPFPALPVGKLVRRVEGFPGPILAADVSRDGSTIVISEENKRISWFNTESGKETYRSTSRSPFEDVLLLPDNRTLLAGALDGRFFSTTLLNNFVTKENFQFKVHTDRITRIGTSITGSRAISGGADKIAVIWDTKKGENLGRLTGHRGEINAVALNRDASKALTASEDRSAILWDVKTLKPLQTITEHRQAVNAVAFSNDGVRFATASKDRTAIVFQTATGKELSRLTGSPTPLTSIAFRPSSEHLLTGTEDGNVVLWDVATGRPLKRFPPRAARPVLRVTFTTDGKQFLCVTPLDVAIWEIVD